MATSASNPATGNLSCTICSEIYKSNDEVLCTKCGHVFHKACFEEWHTRSTTCPECRANQPQTQPIYLHIEDPAEAERRVDEENRLELINQISILERRLQESEQHFFDTQCALTFSNEQVDELKSQIEYMDVIKSSYEEEQTKANEALTEVQLALTQSTKQIDELRNELEYMNILKLSHEQEEKRVKDHLNKIQQDLSNSEKEVGSLNSQLELKNAIVISYEHDLMESEKKLKDLREQLKTNENNNNNYAEEIKTLKLQNEKKITELLQQHTNAEEVSEQLHIVLQNQLKVKQDEVIKLQAVVEKLQNENQSQQQKQSNDKSLAVKSTGKEFLLQENIRRLESKLKHFTLELETEIELSTSLAVENIKLKDMIDTPAQDHENKKNIVAFEYVKDGENKAVEDEKPLKTDSINN